MKDIKDKKVTTEMEQKLMALESVLTNIDKKHGKGSTMLMGDKKVEKIDVVPSGSYLINEALGVGGYPRGRVVEIFGPESSGKTTLALHAIAEAQKNGGIAAIVDAEHALDPAYAKNLGVNLDELVISQPDTGEQALDIVESLVRSGALDLIVVDSVAALVPRAEIEGEMGDSHVGLQARLMSQALRKLTSIMSKTNTTVIFINQLREKVGIVYGNPETTPGGRALKFYSSVRIDIRRRQQIKDGTDVVGNETTVKIVKNKVAPPFKVADINIMYGKGVDSSAELISIAVTKGVVDKSGSWFSYDYKGKSIKQQGIMGFKSLLDEDEKLKKDIESKLYNEDGSAKTQEEIDKIMGVNQDPEDIK